MKLTTYVIIISEYFPKTHKRAGQPTEFITKIECQYKIHTIRKNYEFWKKRFDKIDKGEACLSIRVWTGKPYRSKQKEVFRFDKSDGIGLEKLEGGVGTYENLAEQDGLSREDFTEWFKSADTSKALAIIHFTGFRYHPAIEKDMIIGTEFIIDKKVKT